VRGFGSQKKSLNTRKKGFNTQTIFVTFLIKLIFFVCFNPNYIKNPLKKERKKVTTHKQNYLKKTENKTLKRIKK
jgi:hypothetical protein